MPPKQRVLTPDEIQQVRRLAPYLTQEQLADFMGMSQRTFNNIRERQPEVNATYKEARADIIGQVAQSLVQDALDGDTTSRIFFLKTQGGWRETNILDHQSSDGSMKPGLVQFIAPQIEKDDKGDD
jgi:DNA-binding XRE family transcriptional regulator